MKIDIEEGELNIDIDGLSISTKARYEVTSSWDGGHFIDANATLTGWWCDGEWHSRRDLCQIVGYERVEKVEDSFADLWTETAEANARDAHADLYRRDDDDR